jgi:two-component system nitrogen regulation response regulator GlnG
MDSVTVPAPALLLVDDDAIIAESLEYILSDEYRVSVAGDRVQCIELLNSLDEPPAMALVDLGLPPDTHKPDEGFSVIEYIHQHFPQTLIVVLSGQDQRQYIESARRLGAVDFIAKPCDVAELKARLKGHLGDSVGIHATSSELTGIVGQSQAIELLRMQIKQLSSSPYPVLIEGESGSGKELAALNLHEFGKRREQNFLILNCAAFNGELLESQLFGHARGAFTGASEEKRGFFEEAGSGTLFLDEIADLPLDLQAKLLRVLENGEFYRIGETRPRHSMARVLAASNKNLLDAVDRGEFREDLYHRLSVLTLRVPPLHERGDDRRLLLEYFKHQIDSQLKGFELDEDALALWSGYDFPGNVRELRNIVIRLSAKYPGQTIKAPVLVQEMTARRARGSQLGENDWLFDNLHSPDFQLNEELKRVEQRYIELALQECDNNMSKAAALLGVNRSTLYGRMERN